MQLRPCKNCFKMLDEHKMMYTADEQPLGMTCTMTFEIRKLLHGMMRPVWTMAWFEPMNNLEYLEWECKVRGI